MKPEETKQEISFEMVGKNRERLLFLEKEGRYVFHGSMVEIDSLEPRQAYGYDSETGKMEKDGTPAVFATPFADVAIFRSLTSDSDVPGESESKFGIDGDRLHFSATENLLEKAKERRGKIYVLDKGKFKDFEGMQCRSEEVIRPIEVIEVTAEDLPKNIGLIRA